MTNQLITYLHPSQNLFPTIGRLSPAAWLTKALPISTGLVLCLLSAQPLRAHDQGGGSGNPQEAIRNVRNTLVGLRDSSQTQTEAALVDKAIKGLGRALDPALWTDNTHLQPKTGSKVFGEVANAASRLLTLMAANPDTISISQGDLAAMVDNLLRACGDLAGTAMTDAVDGGGDPIAIADAVSLFQQATDKIGAGNITGGIQDDGAAWKRATEALP